MDIKKRIEKDKKYMFDCLDNIDIDTIQSDGLTIRVGDKMLKLVVVNKNPISEIDEIKEEFRKKINEQQKIIKQKIHEKIKEITEYHNSMRIEYNRKEKELKDILSKSSPMPDVFHQHAINGLSVVKGSRKNTLIWIVQGVYWPKTMDGLTIDPKFSKKMISNVVFMIETEDKYVVSVSTRKPIGLSFFDHYHQSEPDCWGKWRHKKEWKKPEDIIRIAREAEAVLENINTGSIARHNPRGLPREATIKRHLLKDEKKKDMGALNQSTRRSGISENVRENDMDIWSL
jgi:hypothetical protein